MSIFKEVTRTVKNIFNPEDDMVFEEEETMGSSKQESSLNFPKIQFQKKKQDEGMQIKTPQFFDASRHDFNAMQTQTQRKQKVNGRIQVYVPKTFEEGFTIIKDVKGGLTAMVNVEVANPQVSQRLIDLISGAIFALDGDCKKVGEKQYIFSLSTETIGATDYLPINGVPQQTSQFNFNVGQPFDFMNQQQPQPQPQGWQPQFNQPNVQQQMPSQQSNWQSRNFNMVPPQSQF